MVRQLETYSNVEVCGTVRFLWANVSRVRRFIVRYRQCMGTCNVTSSRCEMVPAVRRRSHRLNRCGKARKANNGEQAYQTWCSGWKTLFSAMEV
ncbi:hypothetical protein AVEN_65202-1 [Araneus ventricosus]|uniref:Uncharacterized protein n=1 Tax=Araneus ventricosus TaxID=182803 RepID=A0A4Y2AHC3_ARAVE|nr:hypothetical protein AVEN_65202-1 [Araneus ventricosus]